MTQTHRRAFTLIELLVVIAIILLFTAILFPVFGRTRENARRSTCQSNLRNIGLAFMQYAQDYDEQLPFSYNNTGIAGYFGRTWTECLDSYNGIRTKVINSARAPGTIFKCPSDAVPPPSPTVGARRTYAIAFSNQRAIGVTTGPNGAYSGRYAGGENVFVTGPTNYGRGRKLSEFPAVAGTILLVEDPDGNNNLNATVEGYIQSPEDQATDANSGEVYTPLHFNGWNYLFVDGHVKWLQPEATIGTGSMSNPNGMWSIAEND
jgi:prepilin-type N-terminal cleavage/methylation domain-containing protein/prepilin-type processing-associated H-X9-DG protein